VFDNNHKSGTEGNAVQKGLQTSDAQLKRLTRGDFKLHVAA
jgi:hypothetical protein